MAHRFETSARLIAVAALSLGVLLAPAGPSAAQPVQAAGCPSSPVTISKLANMTVAGNTCYGSRLLTFRAFVPRPDGIGGTSAYSITPSWLNGLDGSWALLSSGRNTASIAGYVPPALGHCFGPDGATCPFRFYANRWVTVSGHFDGPVAQTCRYGEHPPGADFTVANAIAECQVEFIVLSVGTAALPATSTVAASPGDRGSPSPPWVAILAAATVLVALRIPSGRRVPSGRPRHEQGS